MSNIYNYLNLEALNQVYEAVLTEFQEVYKTMKNNKNILLEKISEILLNYIVKDDVLKLSEKEKQKILEELFKLIEESSFKEYKNEKKKMESSFEIATQDTHDLKYYILTCGSNKKYKKLKKETKQDIINRVIDGKLWSDRLWDNKAEIELLLKKDIKNFLDGKISVNKIKKSINDRYSTNASNTNRLVSNEIARCQCEVNEQFFKDEEIEEVIYLATLDTRTCKRCQNYDGKIFKLNESRPKLPLHIGCRCCYIETVPEWTPIHRRDNTIVDSHINFKDYKNWLKEEK